MRAQFAQPRRLTYQVHGAGCPMRRRVYSISFHTIFLFIVHHRIMNTHQRTTTKPHLDETAPLYRHRKTLSLFQLLFDGRDHLSNLKYPARLLAPTSTLMQVFSREINAVFRPMSTTTAWSFPSSSCNRTTSTPDYSSTTSENVFFGAAFSKVLARGLCGHAKR